MRKDDVFRYGISMWAPFRDREVCERIRAIRREDICNHPNPDISIEVIRDEDISFYRIHDIFFRIREAMEANRRLVLILPQPHPQYIKVAYLINRFRVSCRNLYTFNMDEWADEEGHIAPETYENGFMYAHLNNFYYNIDEKLRPPREQIQGINGIKKITSKASEGSGAITIELLEGADVRTVLDEVKARVDAIETFPEEIESPVIQEVLIRQQVINIAISGPTDERTLKELGVQIRDEISALPDITQVELTNARPYEVSIEVSEAALRRYGLTFEDIASAVRRSSLDLPGGSIRAESGEILLRTKGQAYWGEEFEELTLISRTDGTQP